jgi:hypothetical protein
MQAAFWKLLAAGKLDEHHPKGSFVDVRGPLFYPDEA